MDFTVISRQTFGYIQYQMQIFGAHLYSMCVLGAGADNNQNIKAL